MREAREMERVREKRKERTRGARERESDRDRETEAKYISHFVSDQLLSSVSVSARLLMRLLTLLTGPNPSTV